MNPARSNPSRRGVSLIESVAALVILAGAMAAAMNSVASARASQVMAAERAKARVLADSMLAEVLENAYAEPGSNTLGPDAGETNATTRSQFDDVDDYHGWSNTVRATDGTVIDGYDGYVVSFDVAWVDPDALANSVSGDQGVKRVQVTITRNGRTVAQAQGWPVSP